MTKTHTIRLHGPWEYVLANGESGTIKIPAAIENTGDHATVSRRFNWVAAIEPSERVFVVFTTIGGTGVAELNGTRLGGIKGPPTEFDITRLLEPGNQLRLALRFDDLPEDQPPGVIGSVRLEVRTESRNLS